MILALRSGSLQGCLWVTGVGSADSSARAGWQLRAPLFVSPPVLLQNYCQESETRGVTFRGS